MPSIEATSSTQTPQSEDQAEVAQLRFPPITKDHILHCSYDFWFPKYRTSCIKSRVIPLTPEFISYIHEDGIILADDEPDTKPSDDGDGDDDWEPTNPSNRPPFRDDGDEADSSDSDDEQESPVKVPPNRRFPDLHNSINAAIQSLGGAVAPKLNWSSPKDATWISRHPNTMKCTSANDIYILLKSSNFVTHDLDHAFDDTTAGTAPSAKNFSPVLVLRTFFNPLPSLEFRCFVKDRNLVAITQRDLNYYDFLKRLRPAIVGRIKDLFAKMRFTFPDSSWVFDVYIPEAYRTGDTDSESEGDDEEAAAARRDERRLARARLIDINPWAPRTDTLLFGWDELLDIRVARPILGSAEDASDDQRKEKTIRLPIRFSSSPRQQSENAVSGEKTTQARDTGKGPEVSDDDIDDDSDSLDGESGDDDDWEEDHEPELRLVEHDDPAAYNFSSPQYSAHKLPKEVVDASMAGDGGMREFAQRWARIVDGMDKA